MRFDPTQTAWVIQLASLYQADKRPRLAVKLLDELITQKPEEWRALRVRGDAKLSINEHRGAISDYEAALKLVEALVASDNKDKEDVDYSGLLNNLAWVLSTSPQDAVRDGKRSLELGLKACEVTEYKQAHIVSTLAACYAETGDFENARKWAAKAVELVRQRKASNSNNSRKSWKATRKTSLGAKSKRSKRTKSRLTPLAK